MAKHIASIYQSCKRSRDWFKTPLRANCEAVSCGFRTDEESPSRVQGNNHGNSPRRRGSPTAGAKYQRRDH